MKMQRRALDRFKAWRTQSLPMKNPPKWLVSLFHSISRSHCWYALRGNSTHIQATLCNKTVLNILPAPNLLLLVQSLVTLIFIATGSAMNLLKLPRLDYPRFEAMKLYLIVRGLAQISKLYCLQNVDMSFYQVSRGLLLPFTIALSIRFLPRFETSRLSHLACLVTTIGFAFGINGERLGQTSHLGIGLGVISSLSTASEAVASKLSLLANVGVLELVYASALFTTPLCLLFTAISGEYIALVELAVQSDSLKTYLWRLTLASLANCLLCIAALFQIKVTSPTTHMVSTAARGVLQSLLAWSILKEELSTSRVVSLGIILSGTCLYAYAKELESRQRSGYMSVEMAEQGLEIENTTIKHKSAVAHPTLETVKE